MCRVIAVANQKGGVAKTTTTCNLGVALAKLGKKVLLIDADAQGDLTSYLTGKDPDDMDYTLATILDLVMDDKEFDPFEGIIYHEENIDLIPGNIDTCEIEMRMVTVMSRELVLRSYIELIKAKYDFILIDCAPSLGMMPLNCMSCADGILIPVMSGYFPVRGLRQLIRTVLKVKKMINPKLVIEGIVITMADYRNGIIKDVNYALKAHYGKNVHIFNSVISLATSASRSVGAAKSIFAYDPKGKVASEYMALAKEVIDNVR